MSPEGRDVGFIRICNKNQPKAIGGEAAAGALERVKEVPGAGHPEADFYL